MARPTAPFWQAVQAELARAEQMHAPIHSVHEAYAVLLEEVEELWDEVRKKPGARSPARLVEELVQIAAVAWRAARDLGMDEGTPVEQRTLSA